MRQSADKSFWLDLSDAGAEQRVPAWRSWMEASFPEYALLSATLGAGSAQMLSLGSARLWRLHLPAGLTIRAARGDHFQRDAFVSFQLRGSRTLVRDGREFRIKTGEVCVGKASPGGSETIYEEDSTLLLLDLPSWCVALRHPGSHSWQFHVSGADRPGCALLHDVLAHTLTIGEGLSPTERKVALAAALELLPLPLLGLRSMDAHVTRVERVLADIDEQLSDPKLCPERIAHGQGISRRRLDALFNGTLGMPVAACIVERRLARAAQLLHDPACAELSISSISSAAGFRDASHFARMFRRRFGKTPTGWRSHQ
ncbi:MAG TPA: helix-turn-helix domain-containing protein [Polyangiaceae bacterium]|nr:helix-turn-helix domain-containing protein [Polyangiaceae bacterium]